MAKVDKADSGGVAASPKSPCKIESLSPIKELHFLPDSCEEIVRLTLKDPKVAYFLALIKQNKYYTAITYLFYLLNKLNKIKHNSSVLTDSLEFWEKKGFISKKQKRRIQKRFLFLRTFSLPLYSGVSNLHNPLTFRRTSTAPQGFTSHFLTTILYSSDNANYYNFNLRCSDTVYKSFFVEVDKHQNEINDSLNKNNIDQLLNIYVAIFKNLGFFRSKYNIKSFLQGLIGIKKEKKINPREYLNIRRRIRRAKVPYRYKKSEFDHLPPDDLYRFAKDSHIKNLRFSRRPGWKILRYKHRRAISTGRSHLRDIFRNEQRNLFANGEYAKVIENYLKKYIDDGIINNDNIHEIKKALNSSLKARLVGKEDLKRLYTLIGEENEFR